MHLVSPMLQCPRVHYQLHIDDEMTLIVIKPDALKVGIYEEVFRRIEQNDLRIVHSSAPVAMPKAIAESLYVQHMERPFYKELISYITSGSVRILLIGGRDAIQRVRELVGPTDPGFARLNAPKSLRATYGKTATMNSFHASDGIESFNAEIKALCPLLSS